jgi:nitrite reductase/ring-hydroxylating ferredoxin subunit
MMRRKDSHTGQPSSVARRLRELLSPACGERPIRSDGRTFDDRWWVELGPDPVPALHDRAVIHVAALDTAVLLVRTRRGIFACESQCPHLGRKLIDARLSFGKLTCEGHGWCFRQDTGERIRSTGSNLRVWPAMVRHGRLFIEIAVVGREQGLAASAMNPPSGSPTVRTSGARSGLSEGEQGGYSK